MKFVLLPIFILLMSLALVSVAAADVDPDKVGVQCEGVQAEPENLPGADSFTFSQDGARNLRIHVFRPNGAGKHHPAIVFFFGGGWRGGTITAFGPQAEAFVKQGYVAALADYRVFCRDKSSPVEALADARSAYEWLRSHADELSVDPARIVISGGSSGGHLALATAMQEPADLKPAALVLFNPAVDLVSIAPLIHLSQSQAQAISPSTLSAVGLPPAIIFHGKADHKVAIKTVREQCARMLAAGSPCELVEYVGEGHSFYHSNQIDSLLGVSPFEDTTKRALEFVRGLGITDGQK